MALLLVGFRVAFKLKSNSFAVFFLISGFHPLHSLDFVDEPFLYLLACVIRYVPISWPHQNNSLLTIETILQDSVGVVST
ncbi:MAG: hypothetical protein JWP57_2535 [Spirosoma sp.]|nr:hypothetical protein [Spirosoma sp.]